MIIIIIAIGMVGVTMAYLSDVLINMMMANAQVNGNETTQRN
jgi:hypothetical protein